MDFVNQQNNYQKKKQDKVQEVLLYYIVDEINYQCET